MSWLNISGSAKALVYGKELEQSGGIIITRNETEATTIASEIPFFYPGLTERVVYLPEGEVLPYDLETTPPSIKAVRATALTRLMSGIENPILVISGPNLMQPVAAKSFWLGSQFELKIGSTLPDGHERLLDAWGYTKSFRVKSPSTWSQRGKVFDIYPVGLAEKQSGSEYCALRMLLDDDQRIESIHRLDPLTQDSGEAVNSVVIFPDREYPLNAELTNLFRKKSFDVHPEPRDEKTYKLISEGKDHPELSTWSHFADLGAQYLPEILSGGVIYDEGAKASIEKQWALIHRRHHDVIQDSSRIVPAPSDAWASPEHLQQLLASYQSFELVEKPHPDTVDLGYYPSGMIRKGVLKEAIGVLEGIFESNIPLLFVIKSEVRHRHVAVLTEMASGHEAISVADFDAFAASRPMVAITTGVMERGFLAGNEYRVISEKEIFGISIESSLDGELDEHHRRVILQGLHEIKLDEPIVHATKGVGRFQGFEQINMGGGATDMVKIGYADDASTFAHIRDLDLISRYSGGDPEKAPLSKLGDPSWLAALKDAQKSALKVASELIDLRNTRERASGIILKMPGDAYDRFCHTFSYEETPGQILAIQDVIKDLTSGKPMDRLICGDVGFGKTEVAMRAAFLMADQGYQTVVLAPTKLLAQQHYDSFVSRFEETPYNIILASQQTFTKAQMKQLESGAVSIVIGTHKLLQGNVDFNNLGLIIVDEEHRFGVAQKEHLRTHRGNKHVMTMAATPIPRTLSMGLSNIRDMSIIATPPAKRLSVRTLVRNDEDSVIQEALQREMARDGQAFVIHNFIDSMDACVERIQRIVPSARVAKVHGKMSETEMTRIMQAFRDHQYDVLVGTTVIEIGIDVPNANTLIIEHPDRLGLGQMHQIRGRVGRSTRQAYAYLLTSKDGPKEGPVYMRLKAMEQASNLGEGFVIARHDMEIRGIGEILGEEQSGHVHKIGFTLYMRLLSQAIKALDEGGDRATLEVAAIMNSVDFPMRGSIPSDFITEVGERLAWYQRIMCSESVEEAALNLRELNDLYGYLPAEVLEFKEWVKEMIALKHWQLTRVESVDDGVLVSVSHGSMRRSSQAMMALNFGRSFKPAERSNQFRVEGVSIRQFVETVVQATLH
ncbi:helicase-related protein [Pseudomonas taiwanensis]|uniref:DEAD/DEAH box helicase n=1 Tax=Pseudomonas taiwanensis TaxID=470150 RepID=UPI0028DF7388|nr:DEAD/DEAH box helicase [Pseudomonas taiwanensis]MDT8924887.1 helicase-related protein [Pseudomonas taiwanensis]